ncbi:hypothetical protein CVT26_015865 [Gymnopilus dilepis]|uniref:J domain-containing protein n=1 Tax=Gymnopilus dilepis TaxID=231916 RepID=A0A409XYD3_9AGAR|nr:hypothetical protein CVT26_015865 [Gymnopilus dilepis]
MSSMSVQDALRILDVSDGAGPDEIKNAYRTMALTWHPDRHFNSYDKETSARRFLEITDAYRTLVREGLVKPFNPAMFRHRPEPHRARRPPPLGDQTSSESSISVDSFVHMVASSTESLTTPASSNVEVPRSSWKQGVRQPSETLASHYRHKPLSPNVFQYEAPLKSSGTGPALYRPPAPFTPVSQTPARNTSSKATSTSRTDPSNCRAHITPSHHHSDAGSHTPPYSIPLHSFGMGPSGEWAYSLTASLEELFTGRHFRFGITRSYLSGKSKNVVIEIDIPPGCRAGTRILCRNVGHEWQKGVFQDIAFIIEELPHDRFVRLFDDLIMVIRLPWVDTLRRQGGKVPFMGIDGRSLIIQIDYPRDKLLKGRSIVQGAGMPTRENGGVVGRGNLIIQWEILPPKPKIFHFFGRLFGRK